MSSGRQPPEESRREPREEHCQPHPGSGPGAYDLKVCADADNSVCPLDPGSLDLEAGTAYSVFAVDSLEGETLTAVVAVDEVYAPSTSTLDPADSSATFTWAAIMAVTGLALVLMGVRLALRRVER